MISLACSWAWLEAASETALCASRPGFPFSSAFESEQPDGSPRTGRTTQDRSHPRNPPPGRADSACSPSWARAVGGYVGRPALLSISLGVVFVGWGARSRHVTPVATSSPDTAVRRSVWFVPSSAGGRALGVALLLAGRSQWFCRSSGAPVCTFLVLVMRRLRPERQSMCYHHGEFVIKTVVRSPRLWCWRPGCASERRPPGLKTAASGF